MEELKKQRTESLFCPYEQALALKEFGFDEPCIACYTPAPTWMKNKTPIIKRHFINQFKQYFNSKLKVENVSAPTFSQAFRWFREKHGLFGCVDLSASIPAHWFVRIDEIAKNDYLYHSEDEKIQYSTYEEAELACLCKLIEIVKNKTAATIRRVKDSWSREEVIALLQNCWSDSAFNLAKQTKKEEFITFTKWIEENL